MKKFLTKKKLAFLLLIALIYSFSIKNIFLTNNFISIETAIKNSIAKAEVIGKGGHQGNCINISIQNISDKDTLIKIESGRRLVSEDTSIQDILVIKELLLFLKSGESVNTDVFGFCCQAHNGAPYKKAKYDIGFMEDSAMIKLAEFFNKNEYPLAVMQNSVWCLSDDNSINSVHNSDKKDISKMKKLYKLLSELKGEKYEYPWYTLTYLPDSTRAFSGKADKLYGEIFYTLDNYASVDLIIRDEDSRVVETVFSESPQDRNVYTYKFVLDVRNYSKGKYYLRLYADNQMKLLKIFEI